MLEGAEAFVVGLALASAPAVTDLFNMVRIISVFFFVVGILWTVNIFVDMTDWGWKIVGGVLGILVGLTAFYYPLSFTADLYIGAAGIIIGLIGCCQELRRRYIDSRRAIDIPRGCW